jgi:23S rRNA maturation mini-RNase III
MEQNAETVTDLKTFSHIHCLVCQPQTHNHHHKIPYSAFIAVEVLQIHIRFHLVLACWRIDRKTMKPEFREINKKVQAEMWIKLQYCFKEHVQQLWRGGRNLTQFRE